MLERLTRLFPLWVLVGGVAAMIEPSLFTWFRGPWIVWGLAVIMLGMGITLRFADFREVAAVPRPIAVGVAVQFLVMPALAWAIGQALALPTPLAVGLILVGCAPGGTASNVVTYIARASLPFSVLMTMCSTLVAIVMTPLLTSFYAGTMVPVDAFGLFLSTLQVVLIPVLLGLSLNHFAPTLVAKVQPVAPLVAVLAIVMICASIIGQRTEEILGSVGPLLAAVALLHLGGFALGYGLARFLGYAEIIRRTVSIEVGMQNSGLAVVLANRHFADPLTAVPGAISAVTHSILGSLLATIWRKEAEGAKHEESRAA
ncbi:MAG: bile acid:sodium symporter family protein [Deltaproteobacteria bacterium]